MKLAVAIIGKVKNQHYKVMLDEYLKRLKPFADVQFHELKEGKNLLLKVLELKSKATLAALAIQGRHFTSEHLAAFLKKQEKPIVFLIGNENGLPDEILCKADMTLSLSEMTLPHELACVVLAEQLYRAMTIIKGHPYHKGD